MIEELENKINILSVQNEKLKAENEYFRERCKNEYEGFISVVHELCDITMELDKYKSRNEKANEYLPKVRTTSSYELDEKIDYLESILNGGDEE